LSPPLSILVAIYSYLPFWNIPVRHVERLRRDFPAHRFLHATDDERAIELIGEADVAFAAELRGRHLARATRLHWVHSPTAGVGGMLGPEMLASPAVLTNSSGLSAPTIGEHVVAVTLAMFRKLPQAIRGQAEQRWTQHEVTEPPPIRMIAGSRALVIGLGAIGGEVSRRLSLLGATVIGIRRRLDRPVPDGVSSVVSPDRLHDVLPDADLIVIAAPQTRETWSLIGAREIARMKPDALLVNVSRGKLVDEQALIAALEAGAIGGAALDVFEREPLAPESPLWPLPNVLITPHMAGFRADHWDAVTDVFADNLRRFERGEALVNVVDKEAGY
jgi:phosphoglycerate dehydrogenase-like enzyme